MTDCVISIIMPNRNGALFLPAAIDSVLAQTYEDWELIIIDDRSADESRTIIRNYAGRDPRVSHIFPEEQAPSPGDVRNKGLEQAKGRYIAFLDSDDKWHPEKLSRQLQFMKDHDALISTTFTQIIDLEDDVIGHYRPEKYVATLDDLIKENYISTSAAMVDSEKIGAFRFPQYRYCQDYACWVGMISNDGVVNILSEELTQYRIDPHFYIMRKPPKAWFRWKVHRQVLKRSWLQSIIDMINYAIRGLRKSFEYRKEVG